MQTATPDSLSIFFPCYGDWGTIASLVALSDIVARELTPDYEIIVVNDCSPDHAQVILDELAARFPRFRCVRHETNRGYGGALRSGFATATKDFVFYTDGDAQYDVRELRLLWEKRSGADLVNGYKIARNDPLHRKIVGKSYQYFVRAAFGLKDIRDVDCDFRLIRRRVFEKIELTKDSGLITVELSTKIQHSGCRIAEVPVHHFHRMHGRSQFFNFPRVAKVLWGMLGLWRDLIANERILKGT
jgi:glycosyltransferase involved in cell wall biosynthesis